MMTMLIGDAERESAPTREDRVALARRGDGRSSTRAARLMMGAGLAVVLVAVALASTMSPRGNRAREDVPVAADQGSAPGGHVRAEDVTVVPLTYEPGQT